MALSVSYSMLPAHKIWGKEFSISSYNILTLGLKLKSCLSSLLQVLYVTLSFIHLFISLSYERSTASSKASSPDRAI